MIFFLIWTFITVSFASQIFVSTTGNDTTGTINRIDLPFRTIPNAISVAVAGDTIYVRGGTYTSSAKISIGTKSGASSSNMCNLWAYPGESPILDFSSMAVNSSNRGVSISGSYWYVKGFDIYKAGDNGMYISGSNNIIELCRFYENNDTGLQLDNGASNNQILNCDSYFNADLLQGNADGFSPKLNVGTGNYFYGCRAWQNSDDGWDGLLQSPNTNVSTTIENCWSFQNGYLKNGALSSGNGNGFKMGGNNMEHNAILKNCLTFDNKSKGFDQNHDLGSMTLYNCTSYRNTGYNYSIYEALDTGKILTLTNCMEFGNKRNIGAFAVLTTDSWMNPPFAVAPSAADFMSLDTTGVRGPRKSDGSLPDINFMHLASNSQFVNAGTNVGLSFIGTAPDLGCFESSVLTGVTDQSKASIPNTFTLYQNYPNPFNPSTEIGYHVASAGVVKISVYDILGQEVATLVNAQRQPGTYTVEWNAARMSSGMYFARLLLLTGKGQSFTQTRKMMFTK
ncbi:MAG: right-handed parallel beta-helix repeat-containing protein [Bacteroidota bacterium]